ncbi:MAG: ester cyclase [Puniceicoccaceae bacterium]
MNKKDIINTFINEAFNHGNTAVIDELIHQEYSYTSPSDQLNGTAELAAFVTALREAFPDLTVKVVDQVEETDKVCTRLTIEGTHLGPFLDIPASGNSINIEGVVFSRFKDGLIHEEWELLDQYSFLSQLGVIPSLG